MKKLFVLFLNIFLIPNVYASQSTFTESEGYTA